MKRVIDFDIAFNSDIPPIFGLPCTVVDTVRVEFDWDEKEDVMKAAVRALDKQMDKDCAIQYWWWIE